ncbi:hypothetical protein D3C85_1301760 [compost metagenome]
MRPMPMMPRVLPCTSLPKCVGPMLRVQLPSRIMFANSTTRRAVARISAKPVSAVVSVNTSGVLLSRMRRSVR